LYLYDPRLSVFIRGNKFLLADTAVVTFRELKALRQ
jgi:hypothetical protein